MAIGDFVLFGSAFSANLGWLPPIFHQLTKIVSSQDTKMLQASQLRSQVINLSWGDANHFSPISRSLCVMAP
jgi:hypothetical protein